MITSLGTERHSLELELPEKPYGTSRSHSNSPTHLSPTSVKSSTVNIQIEAGSPSGAVTPYSSTTSLESTTSRIDAMSQSATSPQTGLTHSESRQADFPIVDPLEDLPQGSAAAKILEQKINSVVQQSAPFFNGIIMISRKNTRPLIITNGFANQDLKTPITPETKFLLCSLSKQFTAAAILILQEMGNDADLQPHTENTTLSPETIKRINSWHLNVNDSISKYIPDYPRGSDITIHHLLTHASGIPDYLTLPEFEDFPSNTSISLQQTVDLFKKYPLDFMPGEKFSYNSSGFVLLGLIIERVSGMNFEDFLKQKIFLPLKMSNTGCYKADEVDPTFAVGYTFNPMVGPTLLNIQRTDTPHESPMQTFCSLPVSAVDEIRHLFHDSMTSSGTQVSSDLCYSGCNGHSQKIKPKGVSGAVGSWNLYSTANDLYRWNQYLYGYQPHHSRILSPNSIGLLFTKHRSAFHFFGDCACCYGFYTSSIYNQECFGHFGDMVGFKTGIVRFHDKTKTSITILSNENNFSASTLARSIASLLFS